MAHVAPDWYPDPGGSGAERYWDGSAWTSHLRPAAGTAQTGGADPRDRRGLIVGLSIALAVVLTLLVLGVAALLSRDGQSRVAAEPASTTSALSGTDDEWMASVCQPGRFMDGGVNLPESLSAAICLPKAGGSSISIGSFDSVFAAENAAALYTKQGGSYAIGTDRAGTVWVFISSWRDGAKTLSPLREFGFEIQ